MPSSWLSRGGKATAHDDVREKGGELEGASRRVQRPTPAASCDYMNSVERLGNADGLQCNPVILGR